LKAVAITLLVAVLIGILALASYGVAEAWRGVGLDLGVNGWIALFLGVALSLALGVGLMRLVYFSARSGYDDHQSSHEN
jgi:hypothetical protein